MAAASSSHSFGTWRQIAAGENDELREPAVHLETERPILGAQVRPAVEAPATVATRDPGTGDHTIANLHVAHVLAGGDDSPNKLMAENHARPTENRPMVPLGRVCPADRSADDLEQNLASI
jgi:hypothetical protein